MSFEEGNLSTVPIEGTIPAVHDQLPAVEDAKFETQTTSAKGGSGRKFWICLVGSVVFVVLIIGLSVGLAKRNGSSSNSYGQLKGGKKSYSGQLPPTPAPIAIPNTGNREQDVITYVAAMGLSNRKALVTIGSPQRKAALFMANLDPLQLPLSSTNFLQRYATVVMYYSLNGQFWTDSLGFLSGTSECSWHSPSAGVFCNDADQVSEILLSQYGLNGTIPSDIGLLSKLSRLEMYNNAISGSIPGSLFLLTDLQSLQLDDNKINGTLPPSGWGTLSNLQALYLGLNELTGQIPEDLSTLANLTALGLDQNNLLFGNVQLFASLSTLQLLYVDHNVITGTIDDNFFSSLASLEELYLGHNQIRSTIPASIFNHASLRYLDLHLNLFEGPIPVVPSQNSVLEMVAFYNNSLTGAVPPSLSNLAKLSYLDLSNNLLTSSMPTEIALLTGLTYLFLANNKFGQGTTPSEYQSLAALTDLSLQNTQRSGSVPDFFGTHLTNLVLLDLSYNMLAGQLPTSLNNLNNLAYLLVNRNQLTGNVFNSIYSLSNLGVILLDHNSLTGTLDSFCSGLPTNNRRYFIGDCNTTAPQLYCPCCTLCCPTNSNDCNNEDWLGTLEPVWENGTSPRRSYSFVHESVNFQRI